jgi:SAM-dependent methyltransferase
VSNSEPRSDSDPLSWADPSPTYDAVSSSYADMFLNELDRKPFDREILTRFAAAVIARATKEMPVCDLGCGPGHIGGFLSGLGPDVVGVDLSKGMVEQARRCFPSLTFRQGDMTALPFTDGELAGIVCFYSLIHIHRSRVPLALSEMHRAVAAGGDVLVAVHGGEGSLHAHTMADQPANIDATLFELEELTNLMEAAGFLIVEAHQRDPYQDEHPTRRLYVWGRRNT